MARTRTLAELEADVRKLADVESEDDRHPSFQLRRDINQGAAELRDLMIEVRGRSFFRSPTPLTITTTAGTTRYSLPSKFYRLISVRLPGMSGYSLEPFTPLQEPALRALTTGTSYPTHYELQLDTIEILPAPNAGVTIIVEYIPSLADLVADSDTLDGVNGWEEYVVAFAARCVHLRDDELDLAKTLEAEMARLKTRIQKLAPVRDAFRAERVKDVRGTRWLGYAWPRRGLR